MPKKKKEKVSFHTVESAFKMSFPVLFQHNYEVGAKPLELGGCPQKVELKINGDTAFTKRYGKKVKAAGGRYSSARGNVWHRFVHLPINKDTKDLINNIVRDFGTMPFTAIMRGPRTGRLPSWVTVVKVHPRLTKADDKYRDKGMPSHVTSPFDGMLWKYEQGIRAAGARGIAHTAPPPPRDCDIEHRERKDKASDYGKQLAALGFDTQVSVPPGGQVAVVTMDHATMNRVLSALEEADTLAPREDD